MTSQPLLRIYRGLPSEAEAGESDENRRERSVADPLYAVVFSAVIHLLVLGGGSILAAIIASNGGAELPFVPLRPLHTVFIAFILAQCGLGAVCFARSSWSLYVKALVAALVFGGLWLLLIATIEKTHDGLLSAEAWAASIATQTALVIAITTLLELAIQYEPAAARARFGLFHLLLATTGVALVLGIARLFTTRQGFELADVLKWQFFQQLQMAGCTSAALAVGLYASLRLSQNWATQTITGSLVLIGITLAAPLTFLSAFGEGTGATLIEMRWLFGSEGLFLLATLLPLEMLRKDAHISK